MSLERRMIEHAQVVAAYARHVSELSVGDTPVDPLQFVTDRLAAERELKHRRLGDAETAS
jgi:hypothetical protein